MFSRISQLFVIFSSGLLRLQLRKLDLARRGNKSYLQLYRGHINCSPGSSDLSPTDFSFGYILKVKFLSATQESIEKLKEYFCNELQKISPTIFRRSRKISFSRDRSEKINNDMMYSKNESLIYVI